MNKLRTLAIICGILLCVVAVFLVSCNENSNKCYYTLSGFQQLENEAKAVELSIKDIDLKKHTAYIKSEANI